MNTSKLFVTCVLLCSTLATAAGAATFTVNSTADTNDGTCNTTNCTLREAINAANSTAGTDTVDFSLGAGPYTTLPLSLLPTITDPIVIDGATGNLSSPRVVVTGFIDLAWGLKITAGSSIVKNLVINNFRSGPAIELNGNGGSVVTGCYLGTDAGGTAVVQNNIGARIRSSSNNLVGGTSSADRNIISGNSVGIWVDINGDVTGPAAGNRFEGNYIGTNAAADAVLGGGIGVQIAYGVNDNTIGGAVAGAGNVISGHTQYGIVIESGSGASNPTVSGIVIQGNYIGIDASGQLDFGNYYDGILVRGGASNITIGGTTAAARNVISGNNRYGIWIAPSSGSPSNNTIQGNYIGTNASGSAAIGNGQTGLRVEDSTGNLIGAIGTGPSNVISGNFLGVMILLGAGNQVVGNYIGTDATGTVDLGNQSDGLDIASSPDNMVGGTTAGAGNLISGNNESGIRIYSPMAAVSSGTVVQGNRIGSKADGVSALGNTAHGVLVGAPSTTVGGTTDGAANTIAFNGWDGVYVDNVAPNTILGNSIHDSGYLGIDLVPVAYQVNTNDSCDPDTGANGLQNFPILTSPLSGGGQVHIDGSLNSLANTSFRLEVFGNAACDSFGNGEGKTFLGAATVTTDDTCNATINVNLPVVVAAGTVVTATATRLSAGVPIETSEFSACRSVTACVYSITPTSDSFPAGGGSRSVGVTTTTGCNWPAASNDDWITIDSGGSGNGNGTVSYMVAANGGPGRTGTITVAGETFTVTQDAVSPTPTSSATETATTTATATATPSSSATATPSASTTLTQTPTRTASQTQSAPAVSATTTPTRTPTAMRSTTPSATPTITATGTNSPVFTPSSTPTLTATTTPTPCTPEGGLCDDGNACTLIDTCQEGVCFGASPVICTGDACHAAGTCIPATGECLNPVTIESRACDSCEDGIDNDRVGGTDYQDCGCNLLCESFDYAVIGTRATSRRTVYMGGGTHVSSVAITGGAGFTSRASVCAERELALIAAATIEGAAVARQKSTFGNGMDMLLGFFAAWVPPGVLTTKGNPPLVGSGGLTLTDPGNLFPAGNVDLSGTHQEYADCGLAIASLQVDRDALFVLTPTMELGAVTHKIGDPAIVVSGPGPHVLHMTRLRVRGQAVLEIEGDADSVVIVQIDRGFSVAQRAGVHVGGGLKPSHLIWVCDRAGRAYIGSDDAIEADDVNAVFAGTVLAPERKIVVGKRSRITGALLGRKVQLNGHAVVSHHPFTGVGP